MTLFILAKFKPSGDSTNLEFGSLHAIKLFLEKEKTNPNFNLKDYEIYEIAKTHNVDDLGI